jgi:4-hydroxy-4-methyl-2-oxoglutarate aldolase
MVTGTNHMERGVAKVNVGNGKVHGVMSIQDRLRNLDSCAVSDALDQLGLVGQVDGIRPFGPGLLVTGRVVTVELTAKLSRTTTHHLGTLAIEAAQVGDVVVVAHQGRTDCAAWGGNLSRAAQRRGIVGVIVHGAVRDVDESSALGFAVFATASTPRTARGRTQEQSWGEPVELNGLSVSTGDYVVADSTGVVFIGATHIDRVVEVAETIMAKEAGIAAEIKRDVPASRALGGNYEQMLTEGRWRDEVNDRATERS